MSMSRFLLIALALALAQPSEGFVPGTGASTRSFRGSGKLRSISPDRVREAAYASPGPPPAPGTRVEQSRERRRKWIDKSIAYYSTVMRDQDRVGASTQGRSFVKMAQQHYFAVEEVRKGNFLVAEAVYRSAIDKISADPDRCDHAKLATSTLLLALVLQRADDFEGTREVFHSFFRFVVNGDGRGPLETCECPCTAKVLGAYAMFEMKHGSERKSLELARRAAEFDPNLSKLFRWKQFREAATRTAPEPRVPCKLVAETDLPTDRGAFRLRAYRVADEDEAMYSPYYNPHSGNEPMVIYSADLPPFGKEGEQARNVPIRIHDSCITGEVFGSLRCDGSDQLEMSFDYIKENGGAIIYLQQEGRGIGLANKVAALALQDAGSDTVDANTHLGLPEDARQYGVVPSILEDMGIGSVRLLTNNPRKSKRLGDLGVEIEGFVPVVPERADQHNRRYLETKQVRLDHHNLGGIVGGKGRADEAINRLVRDLREEEEEEEKKKKEEEEETAKERSQDLDGATAADDGYCFGRESVEEAVAAVGRGELVVVVDDMDRENEGDFIMAADLCTAEAMATIVRYSSGVVCVGMEGERMDSLGLPAMVASNEDPKGTAFSVTVDAAEGHGVTTGISAKDRSLTMRLLAAGGGVGKDATGPDDFVRPGHIFPLRARDGGTIVRGGHTEAAVDLCRLAGRAPAGVLCEIVSEEDPSGMARLPELRRFSEEHGYVLTSIVDIAQYRRDSEAGR